MVLVFMVPWGLFSQTGKKNPAPSINRPAVEHPFVFTWGGEFAKVRGSLKQKVRREKPGQFLEFRKNGILYRYNFFHKIKLDRVQLKKKKIEGIPRMVLDKVLFKDEEKPSKARLYAVTADFPRFLFEGEARKQLLESLKSVYGDFRPGTGNFLEVENQNSRVVIYFNKRRGKSYVYRISFVSRVFRGERNEFRERLDKNTTREIKEEVDKANRELEISLRKESGK